MKIEYGLFLAFVGLAATSSQDCGNTHLHNSSFYGFDEDEPEWQDVLRMSTGKCAEIGSAPFNAIRTCARAHFYGPEGLEKMRESGKLYSAERNDMVLVLASGCLKCAQGLQTNKGELRISLVKHHPEGSFFTNCKAELQTMSTIEVDVAEHAKQLGVKEGTPTDASIPFIIGATFYERRCWGLFSADSFKMCHRSHFLRIENVHCGDFGTQIRDIPLGDIQTEQFPDRALEYIFMYPIDLDDVTSRMRINIIWGGPSKSVKPMPLPKYDIDCARVLQNDKEYVKERVKNRRKSTDTGTLSLGCDAIFVRHHNFDPPVSEEAKMFPLAFIRAVYKDYPMLEDEFAVNYAPQNYYCFAIDKKSSEEFHHQINSLAKCFPDNVFVVARERERKMDSAGHNMVYSKLECMKILTSNSRYSWKYAILLQNHDFQTKTNEELVEIFKWHGGADHIEYTTHAATHIDFNEGNWTLANLELFKNVTKNDLRKLEKNKGTSAAALSRDFVNWLVFELDPQKMLDQLDSYRYATDEFFFSVLGSNEFLEAPGGFTMKCFNEKQHGPSLTRFVIWRHAWREYCHSGNFRHGICIFGLEDLPMLVDQPFMFGNKMMPDVDDEALQCWHEWMHNRTYLEEGLGLGRIEKYRKYYEELPQLRYNREKGRPDFNESNFDCCYKYSDDVNYAQGYTKKCTPKL